MHMVVWVATPPPPGFFLIFPFFFVALWLLCGTLTSYANGWHGLAKRFRATKPFPGTTWNFQSARIGIANYGYCLTLGANPQGMYLHPMILMRFAHPPLFIPWNEITVHRKRFWIFGDYFVLRLGRGIETSFAISIELAERLRPEAGNQWPAVQAG